MEEHISSLITEYNDFITLFFGLILVIGSIRNWNWLCDPTGKPHAPLLSRGSLRFIFFSCGVILIICGLYFLLQRF